MFNCYRVIYTTFYTYYLWILLIQLAILINPLSTIISTTINANGDKYCNYTNPLTNQTRRMQCATTKVNSSVSKFKLLLIVNNFVNQIVLLKIVVT